MRNLLVKADRDEVMDLPRLSYWLKLNNPDAEYEAWRKEQIAEQEAFEARIDSLIHETPNEKQTMFLWCVFLVTLTYLNNSLLYSQSWY